jgi:hypothetical protein
LTVDPQANFVLYVDGEPRIEGQGERLADYGEFRAMAFSGPEKEGTLLDDLKVVYRSLSAKEVKEESSMRKRPATVRRGTQRAASPDFSRRRIAPAEGSISISGNLDVHFLSKDTFCVVGDYNSFMEERFKEECGPFLTELAERRESVADWSYNFHYNFAGQAVVCAYRPRIARAFQDPAHFSLESEGRSVTTAYSGYWINAIGQMRLPEFPTGKPKFIHDAGAVAHFAFLTVPGGLQDGRSYTLTSGWGEEIAFVYKEEENVSWAVKVDQVGYLPDAGEKYAYAGGWLGTGGELDLSFLEGADFYIVDESSGEHVFSGAIALRMRDALVKKNKVTGETVYEMDFSPFTTPGNYHVYVPGMGRSWSFVISDDAVGECFYIHTRGLYHKRCGIAKEAKYTAWVSGECHKANTYKGGFAPENSHYRGGKASEGFGIFDKHGKRIEYKPFTMVAETATDEPLPDVWGGWHDAADYDRRTMHFAVVRDLLTPFLLEPDKFSDGQLGIPESGNGVPDIVDEAAWGVDVWRRAQNEAGGVGCWLEATSHPHDPNPATDTQRYYLALPTRESTMDYAAHAALLANAYAVAGADAKSRLFVKSAEKA